ncbi:hypothetical protein B0H94_11839 [Salsuginibacillus halophilus]|uniref:Uncharacterized protein n=1 Tax=Salsuginibacillus halophilus TaxID=517424 RepID=A0A2P8H679_9BACI|nr:hypothetical protein [Salsuginibacillus halophilus]PSL41726.1 hypothetical protein B0H94_11839 [Salsuginibacillus halophilus]
MIIEQAKEKLKQRANGETYDAVSAAIYILEEQQEKGLEKYGVSADDADLSKAEWARHLAEEMADGLIYVEALKEANEDESLDDLFNNWSAGLASFVIGAAYFWEVYSDEQD